MGNESYVNRENLEIMYLSERFQKLVGELKNFSKENSLTFRKNNIEDGLVITFSDNEIIVKDQSNKNHMNTLILSYNFDIKQFKLTKIFGMGTEYFEDVDSSVVTDFLEKVQNYLDTEGTNIHSNVTRAKEAIAHVLGS